MKAAIIIVHLSYMYFRQDFIISNGLLEFTIENLCTRTAQSSRGGCSRRVHRIVYIAFNKGNILVNFFTSENIHRELLSFINPVVHLLNKIFVG